MCAEFIFINPMIGLGMILHSSPLGGPCRIRLSCRKSRPFQECNQSKSRRKFSPTRILRKRQKWSSGDSHRQDIPNVKSQYSGPRCWPQPRGNCVIVGITKSRGTWTVVSEVDLSIRPSSGSYRTWSVKSLKPEVHPGNG